MPFKFQAQRAYFNAHRKQLEAQGVNVNEWNQASEGLTLPKHSYHKGMMKHIKQATKK